MANAKRSEDTRTGASELRPDAPTRNQASEIRDAQHPDEKPDPTTVAQVEEITDPDRG